jgi:hypothetical protein
MANDDGGRYRAAVAEKLAALLAAEPLADVLAYDLELLCGEDQAHKEPPGPFPSQAEIMEAVERISTANGSLMDAWMAQAMTGRERGS